MKKLIFPYFLLMLLSAIFITACKKQNYPGGIVAPIFPLYDLRTLHKGTDVQLNEDIMLGSTSISGIVVSDHSAGNMPEGLLVIQEERRLSLLRGISVSLGADATKFVPGDSVVIDVRGALLTRADGILQVKNVPATAVSKIASGIEIPPNRVNNNQILTRPNDYESTLVAIVKAGFDPIPSAGEIYSGDKLINDGFGNLTLRTKSTAAFANTSGLNFNANYYGIIFNTEADDGTLLPYEAIRTLSDVVPLSATPEVADIIITGYMADAEGGDGNYEYMQFMATKDIDFAETNYAVVVTSNAGASSPTGVFPVKGWATGINAVPSPDPDTKITARTYKFNLTSGTVAKGDFFYVGGSSKLINGPNSTSLAGAKWIRSFNYSTTNGDGFGLRTSGLFANSGNTSGFAVFKDTLVDVNSAPIDVIFIVGSIGNIYQAPNVGYKIANNDFYDKIDPITLTPQPFFRSGTNTLSMAYQLPSDQGFWNKLGGVYDTNLGKWVKARAQFNLDLTKSSTIDAIEKPTIHNIIDGSGNVVDTTTVYPTMIK